VEEKTSEVIEAMKKRRILEKLREREKDAHTLALNRLEIKMLDDTTMPRYTMETRV
jgi:flagellar biosynthesis chaperone FliJ